MLRCATRARAAFPSPWWAEPPRTAEDLRVAGWWNVAPKQCSNLKKYVKGKIYLFAQEDGNPQVAWRGDALAGLRRLSRTFRSRDPRKDKCADRTSGSSRSRRSPRPRNPSCGFSVRSAGSAWSRPSGALLGALPPPPDDQRMPGASRARLLPSRWACMAIRGAGSHDLPDMHRLLHDRQATGQAARCRAPRRAARVCRIREHDGPWTGASSGPAS